SVWFWLGFVSVSMFFYLFLVSPGLITSISL
ncbi:unnamed protein product, partial [marine sediment metagenome]